MQTPLTRIRISVDERCLLERTLEPGEYVIGREAGCEILVEAGLVSRRHARLTVNYSELLIEDLGSSNGTSVSGRPVAGTVRLWPGQTVRIGEATLTARRVKSEEDGDSIMPWTAELRRQLPEELRREGRYAIQELVAQGGMGAILNARDRTIRRTVAMKVMLDARSGEEMVRFIEEAQVTGQLEHPNIVPIYELGVDECEQPFYTMKFVRGITLKTVLDLLAEGRPEIARKYPLAALLTVFQKVCDAVAFAHSHGVIHRDLKPENVMIGDFGEVLVMDWGLAKAKHAGAGEAGQESRPHPGIHSARTDSGDFGATMAGTVMGTPSFMAPEQAEGRVEELDARTDVFALGGILYSLLTLQLPFTGETVDEILEKVVSGKITAPSSLRPRAGAGAATLPALLHLPGHRVPDSLSAVAMKALATRPEDRYQSVPELQRDIEAYQGGFATRAEKAGARKQLVLLIKRNKTVSSAVATLLLLSAAFTGKVLSERNRAERSLAELRGTAPVFEAQYRASLAAGNLDDAFAKIGYAVTLMPEQADYLLERAHLLESTQRLSEAAAAYRQVLALRSGDASAQTNLELCQRLLNQSSGGSALSAPQQNVLLDSLVAQHRDLETGPLSRLLRRDVQTNEAAIRARLAPYVTQKGWKPERIHGIGGGTFSVDLSLLQVGDLHVLQGLPISSLNLGSTSISDLGPLAGLPLTILDLSSCRVADLAPLRGMHLRELSLFRTSVQDLSPLAGMPLQKLNVSSGAVITLAPLRRAPLMFLQADLNRDLTDLTPLEGMPLETLSLRQTGVKDLRPLRALPLRTLDLRLAEHLTDLTPLTGHPTLESLTLPDEFRGDVSVLASMPRLQQVVFRQDRDGRVFTPAEFVARYSFQVPEIKAVREALAAGGMKEIEVYRIAADSDHLLTVNLANREAVDLRPFRGLALRSLHAQSIRSGDVSPLADCLQLETLVVEVAVRTFNPLRALPKLKYLQNGSAPHPSPAAEFWKAADAKDPAPQS